MTFLSRLRAWIVSSLQRKLVVTLAAVLAAVSAVFLVVVADIYRERITAEHARASMQINALLQAALENAMLKRDLPGLHGILSDLDNHPDIAAVRILNPDLEVRFASDPRLENTHLESPEIRATLASQTATSHLITDAPGGAVLRSINPVHNQPPCQTCHGPIADHPINGLLVVDYAAASINAEAQRGVLFLALSGLAVILATSLAVWAVVTRTVLHPLGELSHATQALAVGRLDYRIPTHGRDQIADLGANFNAMAMRLQGAMATVNASENLLQSVIDGIPDGIRVIDSTYRIVKANTAYAAHVGQPLDRIIGAPCYRSSHGRDTPCPETLVCCPLVEMRNTRAAVTCRQTHLGTSGEVHVEVAAAPVDIVIDGTPRPCVVEAIRDLEQQARIGQEHRLAELGLLAAGLAHEIFNPLSSVQLLLSALQEDTALGLHDETPARLHTLRAEVQRTLSITDSLLMLCLPPSPEPLLIDLDRVIPEALSILSFQARQTGARIVSNIAKGLRVMGSDSDIRMMLTNLVMNALHAMPEGGTATVTAHSEGADVVIEVTDTGHGIAPADLSKIFLPFWTRRADGTGGRGLGLSIVQAIVERAKGRIAVESTLGKGTRFTIHMANPDAPFAGAHT